MARWAWIAIAVVVGVLAATQVLVPGLGERQIEDRLTEGGGSAEVTLGAVPALRLLFGDGERFEVSASELELDLDRPEQVFERLDGFAIVDVSIADSSAGPFELDQFELSRDGDRPYRFVATGETSVAELAELGLESFAIPGESLLDAVLEPLFGGSEVRVPIDLEMELTSEDGRVRVVSGGGTVAGVRPGRWRS